MPGAGMGAAGCERVAREPLAAAGAGDYAACRAEQRMAKGTLAGVDDVHK